MTSDSQTRIASVRRWLRTALYTLATRMKLRSRDKTAYGNSENSMHCDDKFKFHIEGELEMNQSATFTVSVASAGPAPLTLTPDGGSLPPETVGVAVSGDVVTVVSGGVAPYGFAVTGGAVPDGMSLESETNADGTETVTLTGTPTTAGDFSFDLQVTDSAPTPATVTVRAVKKVAAPAVARKK